MPELDGVSIIAFASFAGLILAWIAAPSTAVVPAVVPAVEAEPLPVAA
jgi:hypothetical protein